MTERITRLLGEIVEVLPQQQQENERKVIALTKSFTARYIKVIAETIGQCPAWHSGNGGNAWLFVDELSVE